MDDRKRIAMVESLSAAGENTRIGIEGGEPLLDCVGEDESAVTQTLTQLVPTVSADSKTPPKGDLQH